MIVISTFYELINFVLVENNIYCILLIILSFFYLNNPDNIKLKSLCKKFISIKIAILSQIFLLDMVITFKQLLKNCISKKTLVINLLKSLSLLVLR